MIRERFALIIGIANSSRPVEIMRRIARWAGGKTPVEGLLDAAQRTGAPGDDPRRGALEEVKLGDLGLDLGDELDRARAGADHGDALAGEVVVVVPARGVEDGALEGAEALDVGELRLAQRAGGGDQRRGR